MRILMKENEKKEVCSSMKSVLPNINNEPNSIEIDGLLQNGRSWVIFFEFLFLVALFYNCNNYNCDLSNFDKFLIKLQLLGE